MNLILRMACVAAVLGAVAGCGGDDDGGASERPTVVATTGFAADVVEAVSGGAVDVVQLVPDSSNPHSYSASAKDRRRLAEADLVVLFGRHYEEGLPLDEVDAPKFAFAERVGRGEDPHVWMDPARLARAVPALAGALAEVDTRGAARYARRGAEERTRLERLDAELRRMLARVPRERRKLVTSHDSLGYFAERYGFRVVGAPFGLSPEAEASAEDVAEVIRAVRRERVPAVFAQQGDDPKVMRRIAEEADVRVVDDLLVENPGPQARTYADALRFDARRIAEALG